MRIFSDNAGEHHVFAKFFRHITLHPTPFILRICAVALTGILGIWGFPTLLNRDPQQTVAISVADNYAGSRAWQTEYTAQQLPFRWVPSEVTIPVALWSPTMLFHTHTWLHPAVETATLRVGNLHVPLNPRDFQSPRVVHLLLAPAASTRIQAGIDVTGSTAQWAFTRMQVRPTDPWQMLPQVAGAWLVVWAGMTLISIRWWPAQWHWGVLGSGMMTTLALSQIIPLGSAIADLIQHSALPWIVAGVTFIGVLCWWAPPYLRWMKQRAHVPRFVIGVYTLITIVPLGFTFFQSEFAPWPIAENRQLAPWPQWQDPIQYSAAAEAWLMDHIGLRALMIRSKNELDYRLLRSSRRVYFGKDDVLFLRRWNDERFPALTHILTDPRQRTTLARSIATEVAWYQAQGLTCYVIIVPSKDIIYPELLPWYVPRYNYERILAFEAELQQQGIPMVPTHRILADIKDDVPQLYYPQDFHWNRIAAYHVGQHILADLQTRQSGQAVALPPLSTSRSPVPIHDRTFAALLSDDLPYPPSYEGRIERAVNFSQIVNPKVSALHYTDSTPARYPHESLLVVGDSFSISLQDTGFAGGFPTVYRTGRPRDRDTFAAWLATTDITTVVWQLRDVSLPLYLADQEEQ